MNHINKKIGRIVVGEFNYEDNSYDGYIITDANWTSVAPDRELDPSKVIVMVGVDNNSQCCEKWGYLSSDDNLDYYTDAIVTDVRIVDRAYNSKTVVDVDEGGIVFVDIYTTKGMLQLSVYNANNGYYGHDAIVIVPSDMTHIERM
jgi:hypothetical protein